MSRMHGGRDNHARFSGSETARLCRHRNSKSPHQQSSRPLYPARLPRKHPDAPETRSRTDLFGDPLPPGGWYAWERSATPAAIRQWAFRSWRRHKTFATVSRITRYGPGRVVCLWDAVTGKELYHLDNTDFEPYEVFFLKSDNLLEVFGRLCQPAPDGGFGLLHAILGSRDGKKGGRLAGSETGRPMARWGNLSGRELFASARQEPSVVVWSKSG